MILGSRTIISSKSTLLRSSIPSWSVSDYDYSFPRLDSVSVLSFLFCENHFCDNFPQLCMDYLIIVLFSRLYWRIDLANVIMLVIDPVSVLSFLFCAKLFCDNFPQLCINYLVIVLVGYIGE